MFGVFQFSKSGWGGVGGLSLLATKKKSQESPHSASKLAILAGAVGLGTHLPDQPQTLRSVSLPDKVDDTADCQMLSRSTGALCGHQVGGACW